MPDEAWTSERVALLKQLWAKGETATAIGARLGGLSRSAVLGKIFRLRLCVAKAGQPTAKQKNAVVNDDRGGKRARERGQKADAVSLEPTATKKAPARRRRSTRGQDHHQRPRAAAGKRGKTLLELTNDCCRWPHGRPGTAGFFFCGAAGADLECGMPYCPRHMRRAYHTAPAIVVQASRMASRAAQQTNR